MERLTRRRFLGVTAAGATASVAGCSGILGGSGLPEYSEWLAADVLGDLEDGGAIHADLQLVMDEWPDAAQEELGIGGLADDLEVDESDLEEMIVLERGSGWDAQTDVVLTGSFDQDALVQEMSGGMGTDEYEGYEVIMNMIAVSPDAIIVSMSGSHEELIDAKNGDADRIVDTDDDWDAVLRDVAGAGISGVMLDSEETFELMGIAMNAEDDGLSFEAYVYFEDAETAEAEKEDAEAEAEDEFVDDDGEITDIRVEDNVVIVEAEIRDFEW